MPVKEKVPEAPLSAVGFNESGQFLASYSSQDLSIQIWNLNNWLKAYLAGFDVTVTFKARPLEERQCFLVLSLADQNLSDCMKRICR